MPLYLFFQRNQKFLMSNICHYHTGQLLAFKTQIGLKLLLFQLNNLLLLPLKLCLMGYALPFNHTVFLFLHETVDQILQQSQQTQSCQDITSHSPIRQIPRTQNLKRKLYRCQNSIGIIYLHLKNITSIGEPRILLLQIASTRYPLVRISFQPIPYLISIITINRITQCKIHRIKLRLHLGSRLHDQCFPLTTEFINDPHSRNP